MFTGYEILEKSRNALLAKFPPKYERVICHHITEKYGVKKDEVFPDKPEKVSIVGYIDNDGVEGFVVAINGSIVRKDGGTYHITHSIAENRKPADTNKNIDKAVPIQAFDIQVEPKNFW